MSKMTVRYEARRGVNYNMDKIQTLIVCSNAYDCKDALKEMGFKWNSMGKTWEKAASDDSFMTEFVKVVVACGMTYDDVLDSFAFIPESVQASGIEEEALSSYNDYMDSHPEWF